jgi:hypothetical protein
MESGLLYFNSYLYEKEKSAFQKALSQFFKMGEKLGKKAAGFSSEHLIFNFSPQGIDQLEKIKRIHELFGSDVQILLIVREHRSLILSLYREFVRMGLPYTFEEFSEWLYKYQDRNFLYDIMYSVTYERLRQFFPEENIHIFRFEDYKSEKGTNLQKLFDKISSVLRISNLNQPIQNFNVSLTDAEVMAQIDINHEIRYDYGDYHLEGIENHRRRVFFNQYLGLNYPEEKTFRNVILKRKALSLARERAEKAETVIQTDNPYFRKILEIYQEDRQRFDSMLREQRRE